MRIAIIAETFLPAVNGVTHSLQKLLQYLRSRGDEVLVIAPSTTAIDDGDEVDDRAGVRVERLPSVPLAGYSDVRIAAGGVGRVRRILAAFEPEVVHPASPCKFGWRGVRAELQSDRRREQLDVAVAMRPTTGSSPSCAASSDGSPSAITCQHVGRLSSKCRRRVDSALW